MQSISIVLHSQSIFAAQQKFSLQLMMILPLTTLIKDVHGILKKADSFVAGVCNNFQLAKPNTVSNSETHQPVEAASNSNSLTTRRSIAARWVPPPSANDTSDDYHNQVLGDAGYLRVLICPDQAFLVNIGLHI
jgi:hypothetical protein